MGAAAGVTGLVNQRLLLQNEYLIAQKFDGSNRRSRLGRPPITPEIEALIVRMARENSGWGYDRIVGALANLGHRVSDQTVGNVLRRYGIRKRQASRAERLAAWPTDCEQPKPRA